MKFPAAIFTIILAVIATLPEAASAQDGLVSCTGLDCNFCSAVTMAHNIGKWLVGILILIATIMLAVTGVQMAASAGNSDAKQLLKERLQNIIIGFILILAAVVIIDTLMKALVTDAQLRDYWNTPLDELCATMERPTVDSDPDQGAPVEPGTGNIARTGVDPTGEMVEYGGYQFDAAVVENMEYIAQNYDLRVSGGHRTSERNSEVDGSPTSYHLSGRAGDFVGTQSSMQAAKEWADANGAVETLIHNAGSGTHLHVAW